MCEKGKNYTCINTLATTYIPEINKQAVEITVVLSGQQKYLFKQKTVWMLQLRLTLPTVVYCAEYL